MAVEDRVLPDPPAQLGLGDGPVIPGDPIDDRGDGRRKVGVPHPLRESDRGEEEPEEDDEQG